MAHRAGVDAASELVEFRQGLYSCFTRWSDALFELCDAALCAPGPISSVPALSLEPEFRRSHGSLYKALAKGEIDTEELRVLLVARRPSAGPSSSPSTLRHGIAATPSAALSGAFTTRRRSIRPDSPSWPGGPISGSAS